MTCASYISKKEKGGFMKNLVLLVTTIFLAASTSAYSAQTSTKDCSAFAESTQRVGKNVKKGKKKESNKSKARSN